MTGQQDLAARRANLSPGKQGLLRRWMQGNHAQDSRIDPVRSRRADEPIPLSFAQERLWILEQLQPENFAYNIPMALRLAGQLHVDALEQSLAVIVQRHEALRTAFVAVNGTPHQIVGPIGRVDVPLADLRTLLQLQREAEVRRIATEEVRRPFDLTRRPLLRATLLRLDEEEYVLLLVLHHIISDGWSMGVLVHELSAIYDAIVANLPTPLPDLPIQYTDFALWQRDQMQGRALDAQLRYWQERLVNLPTLQLPIDRPRPPIQSFRGAHYAFALSQPLSEQLKALSRQEGTTLFMTLLAAFQVLLRRYSGQDDVVVGTPIANRIRPELEGLIGLFANTLLLRTSLAGNPSFRLLLQRVREVCLGAFAHQDLPFEKLVEALGPKRDPSLNPLFQVMLVLQNAPMDAADLMGLKLRSVETLQPLGIESGASKFDLTLYITDTAEGLRGVIEYNTDLFDAATVERLAGHYRQLLSGIVADPAQPVAGLPLLTEAERRRLHEWNATWADYPRDQCIHQLFEAQVARTPDAVAVACEGEQWTYRELNARANQLAHHLNALGVGPETRVAICVERSLAMVVGLLGILKAGGAYMPLDPAYPLDRLDFMLRDTQAPVLLTQQGLLKRLPRQQAEVICLDTEWQLIAQQDKENLNSGVTPSNLAYVIYTSGSTGTPKGVMVPHRGICNRLTWMQDTYQLTSADRVLQKTPFSFDVAVWEFFWPLFTGTRLVVARPEGHRDNEYLVKLIIDQSITVLHFVPSMLQVFLEGGGLEECTSLRFVFCSGEALPTTLRDHFFARSNAQLHNLYGPTEASIDVTFYSCQRGSQGSSVPIGRPIANTQVYVLDMHLQPVPIGVSGELFIGGDGLARGYLNRPELTSKQFIPHPFSEEPGVRLYRTGDLARYLPTGDIEFIGRLDHQVKLRGYRIELGEIEATLTKHPAVREAVVVAREDSPGNKRLVAYVVTLPPEPMPSQDELVSFLKARLPEYTVPAFIVVLEAFPLTSNGKVDRNALPVPSIIWEAPDSSLVAPRTPIEEVLAGIWMEVLGMSQVSMTSDFFRLGGDSIRSIQVVARARRAGLALTPMLIFQHPTIEELATMAGRVVAHPMNQEAPIDGRALTQLDQDTLNRLVGQNGQIEDIYPLAPLQEHMFFRCLTTPEPGLFIGHQIMLIEGVELDAAAFEQAWRQVANRYSIARTSFTWQELDQPLQVVHRQAHLSLEQHDWRHLARDEQEKQLEEYIRTARCRGFDLSRPTHWCLALIRLAEDTSYFVWCFNYFP